MSSPKSSCPMSVRRSAHPLRRRSFDTEGELIEIDRGMIAHAAERLFSMPDREYSLSLEGEPAPEPGFDAEREELAMAAYRAVKTGMVHRQCVGVVVLMFRATEARNKAR